MIIGAGNAQESNHPGSKAVIRALGYDCFVFRDVKECFVLTLNPEINGGMNGATA